MSAGAAIFSAVDLNSPGRYVHWSIFEVSVSNLVLILAMVVIFGAALVFPFPRSHRSEEGGPEAPEVEVKTIVRPITKRDAMWTARIRRRTLSLLPPDKLLPDTQPAYVSSWVYVFGVATLAALAIAVVSGGAIALGGTDWWHTNPVGHFFNSVHLWSVELFMAFMVIHLWGKFWMAAWRGKRVATWMTGVIAFVASVIECFTGYLSQQNFDAQWISANGKDAFNSVGVGAFFDLMNFGQMLLWHVVLVPIVLLAIVVVHVLLVRVRGVSHPLPGKRVRGRANRRLLATADATEWKGPKRRYDIVKEATAASLIALVLVVVLAAVLSSPDDPPVTVATWAKIAPADFVATAASELAGTSETATYGPPYNHGSHNVQKLVIGWQMLAGVRQPINAAETFVLSPLSKLTPFDPALAQALSSYNSASKSAKSSWDQSYLNGVTHMTFKSGVPTIPASFSNKSGPVPVILTSELTLARSGGLDSDLLAQRPFFGTDFTKPMLFLEDGSYFASLATSDHLTGSQWGVMNETGSYPGQPWLWLYTIWYQVPGFRSSANVDMIAVYMTGLATLLLLGVPFLPGLRDIPRYIPLHRLVWRDWNKQNRQDHEV